MIWSKYNYLFKNNGHFYLYNSLSNGFAELERETYWTIWANIKNIEALKKDGEIFDFLLKMKAIVNSDQIEFEKIKYMALRNRFKGNTLQLTINPTLDCNFACPYCFENEHSHNYMTEKTEDKIIEFIKKHRDINRVFVTWFGGEPLLAFKRIQSLTRKIEALGLHYNAGMITNGYLFNKDNICKLKTLHIKSIQITLDGLATIHDSRRCLKNGGKTFDKIIFNISLLNELSPETHVNIRMNIDRTNLDDFVKLYTFIQNKKFKNVYVTPAFVEDKDNPDANPCVFNSAEKALFIKKLLNEHGLSFSLLYPQNERRECTVRNPLSVVIGPQGELYKCWHDVGNSNMIYGSLERGITNEKVLLDYYFGADPFEDKSCIKCKLLPVCSGGCPHTRLQAEKNGIKRAACPPIKNNLKSFLMLHKKEKEL